MLSCFAVARVPSYVPPLAEAVVYEENLRAESSTAAFRSLRSRLPQIKALGVNVLWLMPVQPVGKLHSAGGLGSPYATADFDAVNPEFGTPNDLKDLVAAAHRNEIAVIVDWVADHTSWDNPWIVKHPDWYLHGKTGEIVSPLGTGWKDVAGLDYANPAMKKAMAASMQGWLRRYDIDGFRCDASDRMPLDFWKKTLSDLRATTSKKLFMLAEGFQPDDYQAGFDLTYGWNFNTALRQIYGGKSATELAAASEVERKGIPPGARRLRFITNHDMAAWDGSNLEFYKTPEGVRAAQTITALYGGTPLIYSGQEVSWPNRIAIFDRTGIDWSGHDDTKKWISDLFKLRRNHPSLQDGNLLDSSTQDAVVFTRLRGEDQALVLGNVRNRSITISIPTTFKGDWTDGMSNQKLKLGLQTTLVPYQTLVLIRRNTPY